jgi:hypothetical protein
LAILLLPPYLRKAGKGVRHLFAVAVLVGAVSSAAPLNADEPITVSVYPRITVARGEAHLTINVERNDQNRVLSWEVDSRNYYRSSTAQLDGAESPRSWFFALKDLAPGTYQVRATVKRSNNSESVAVTQMRVVGITN